jgi:predicted nucleotide-binding protein
MNVSELIAALEEFQTKLTEHQELLERRAGQRAEFSVLEKKAALEEQSRWLSRRLGALRPYIERFDNEWMMQDPANRVTWDALDVVTSLTGHPGKNHSFRHVFPKLHQILGRLETLDPKQEIPADTKPAGTPISGQEDWITARSAIALLGLGHQLGRRTICQRAHAGLIKAQAERFASNGQSADNVEIPRKFWWAKGEAALTQNWATGDFETWINGKIHLEAYGVTFRRADIERLKPEKTLVQEQHKSVTAQTVFIGHGHSSVWRELSDFIEKRLHLSVDEFNNVSVAGVPTATRLEEMLDGAAFAFLVMTADDELPDGKRQARLNVVHETGLFQGRLGFKKAIVLLEEGCEDFSNIHGLTHIPFPKCAISAKFEEIRAVLEREGIILPIVPPSRRRRPRV